MTSGGTGCVAATDITRCSSSRSPGRSWPGGAGRDCACALPGRRPSGRLTPAKRPRPGIGPAALGAAGTAAHPRNAAADRQDPARGRAVQCSDLIAPKPSLAQIPVSVYNTHYAESRPDQAAPNRWLASATHPRQPPSVRAPDQAGHDHRAASEEGPGNGPGAGDSQTGWFEVRN